MVNYKFEWNDNTSLYIDEDRQNLVDGIKEYLYSADDEAATGKILNQINVNIDTLENKGQEQYFLDDVSEIVTELLEEDALEFLKSSGEAYQLYLKNIGKETEDKTVKKYQLKDLLDSEAYNDLIGWSNLKFGRDISFDNPNVNLPAFDYATFCRDAKIPQYMVEAVNIPIRLKVSMKSKDNRLHMERAVEQYREEKDSKEELKQKIISNIIRLCAFSISWNIKGDEKHHAEVFLPPKRVGGTDVFQELQDAKRRKIRRENVGSGQWRMENSDPVFSNGTVSEENVEIDGSDLNVDVLDWLDKNFDKEVLSGKIEWEIKIKGTAIEDSIDEYVDGDFKTDYLSGNTAQQRELDTIYAFKYKLQLLRPAISKKEKPKMKAGQVDYDEEGLPVPKTKTFQSSGIAGYRLEEGDTPIGKNDYAEKGERITIYRLKESARTQRSADNKLNLRTRIMMPEEYEQLNEGQRKLYDETTSVDYKGNYIKKGAYNRLNKKDKADARKIEVTPEEYSKMGSFKQQGYKPISGEKQVYPDTPENRERNRVGEPKMVTVPERMEPEEEPEEENKDKETEVKSKKTVEEALEAAKETLKNSRIKITRYSNKMGKFDFSPYSRQGERENEPMRELISEFRANLVSLERIGINIEEV